MRTKSNNIEWRITQLESNYKEMDGKIDQILQNHLPHLKDSIISLETKINILSAINIAAIILGVVVSKFLK